MRKLGYQKPGADEVIGEGEVDASLCWQCKALVGDRPLFI